MPPACEPHDAEQARTADPFALVEQVGTEPPLEAGFSSDMELRGFDEALTRLDFTDGTRQIQVRWPRALTLFVAGEEVRVSRSRDWLLLRSLVNETAAVLHVSTGKTLPGTLEPLPEDAIDLRFTPQCELGSTQGCGQLAVQLDGSFEGESVTVRDGWPGGPQGGHWGLQHWTAVRQECAGAGYASVIVGDGLLWMRDR